MIRWSVKQGNKKRRKMTPEQRDFLDSEPELDVGEMILLRGYVLVGTCRSFTFGGMGPVPVTAIWQWVDRSGMDARTAKFAERVLLAVDHLVLSKDGP